MLLTHPNAHEALEYATMSDATTNADALPLASHKDVLTAVLHHGATQMLAQAIKAEVDAYLEAHADLRDEAGRQLLVRNGFLPQRTILTGIGAVEVKQPRVKDRRPASQQEKFSSAILPELLSNVVAEGCVRRRWFAPPHRQTAPRRSLWLTTASRSAPAISSMPIPSA